MFKSVQTLLKFTHLTSGKSSGLPMDIISHNSHEDSTKCAIKSGWSRFNHCSKSLVYHLSWKTYLVIIGPNSHENLPKSNLDKVEVNSNIFSKSLVYSLISPVWSLLAPVPIDVGVSSTIA